MQKLRLGLFSAVIVTFAFVTGAPDVSAQQGNPFSKLAGKWRGTGEIRLAGGGREKLSCRAAYSSAAVRMSMTVQCASPSYRIGLKADLADRGGRITGTWTETSFGAEGQFSGRATPAGLRLRVGGTISGGLSISVSGSSQRIALSTSGSDLQGVTMSLSR